MQGKTIGYLQMSDDPDLEGTILIKPEFLSEHWVVRADVINDWIEQIQLLIPDNGDKDD